MLSRCIVSPNHALTQLTIDPEQCTHHQTQQFTAVTSSTKPTATQHTWPNAQCSQSTGHRVCATHVLKILDVFHEVNSRDYHAIIRAIAMEHTGV